MTQIKIIIVVPEEKMGPVLLALKMQGIDTLEYHADQADPPPSPAPDWLIWSNEHRAWWAAGENGYTRTVKHAGRYTYVRASVICKDAATAYSGEGPPNETMLHISAVPQ